MTDAGRMEKIDSFLPFDTGPLPRALSRFGTTFPRAIADAYAHAYTPRRGVILDPFARPASAADAAEGADRRAVARHVALFGEWARRVLAYAPAETELRDAFAEVRDREVGGIPLHAALRELYASICPTCRAPVVVEAFLWERDAPAPSRKAFRCGVCGREARSLLIEPTDEDDLARAARVDADGAARAALAARFGDGDARAFGESVVALYTPRNAAALELLLAAIDATLPGGAAAARRVVSAAAPDRDDAAGPAHGSPASRAQAFLRLALLEPLVAGSRLNAITGGAGPLRIEKGRARRGSAAQHREVNVWLEFERSCRELSQFVRPGPPPEGGIGRRPALGRASAPLPELERAVAEEADLVLFEAPTADLLGGWHAVAAALLARLREDVHGSESRASVRERVLAQARSALLEAQRASRPNAPAVAYVPHADAGTIAAVALAGTAAGYHLRRVLYQRDALSGVSRERSAAAALVEFERAGTLVKDAAGPVGAARIEDVIRDGVRGGIVARGEPLDTDRAAVAALEALAAAGLLPALVLARGGGVSELEVFLDHFRSALADAAKSGIRRVERAGEDAYVLATPGTEQTPLDDRVEWTVYSLLSTMRDADTRSLLRRTYAVFRGIETPDRDLVLRCLASYGVQDEGGRWRLRAADELRARQEEQAALVADLAQLARRLGFKVWIGRHLQRRQGLADLMTEAERRVHLPLVARGPGDVLGELDCIWYGRGQMVFLWKIDWTARLHQSLVAVGEAIPDGDRVFRFLVVPEERRDLIRAKFQRAPLLAGVAQQRAWRLVKYAPLRAFARQAEVDLYGLEPLIGLEPAVEQAGHQLVFNW